MVMNAPACGEGAILTENRRKPKPNRFNYKFDLNQHSYVIKSLPSRCGSFQ
jgi:hypothetical protein